MQADLGLFDIDYLLLVNAGTTGEKVDCDTFLLVVTFDVSGIEAIKLTVLDPEELGADQARLFLA
jgi:hypothetical protein